MSNSSWRAQLAARIQPRANNPGQPPRTALVGIGNELNGDDAVGILAVRALRARLGDQPHLLLVEGGLAPENFTGPLRRFAPEWVILIDAAEMGCEPGAVAWVDWRQVDGLSASTHSLPPTVLGQYLMAELGCQLGLIGIQPGGLEFDAPLSPAAAWAVDEVAAGLAEFFDRLI